METSLMILCIILGGAALFSVIHCLLLKRQIRDIIRQNHFIQNEDTNLPITAAMPDKEVEALIESINALLETHRLFEIRMTQANRSFKTASQAFHTTCAPRSLLLQAISRCFRILICLRKPESST